MPVAGAGGKRDGACGHVIRDAGVLCARSSSLSGCTVLLHGPAGSGKATAVSAASRRLNLHLLKVDCVSACADTHAASEARLSAAFQRAEALRPCVLLLRNLQLLLRPRGDAREDGRVQAALCRLLHGAPARSPPPRLAASCFTGRRKPERNN